MNRALRAPAWLAGRLSEFASRVLPSSFTMAVVLTAMAMLLAVFWAGASPGTVVAGWGDGFFSLLSFSMQMALMLFCGSLLASTRVVQRLLEAVASLATTPRRAVALTALCSMLLATLNWALSLVGSALLVRAIARRQPRADYRLLVACAYFGMGATWHAGLSASAPLLVATPGHFLESRWGLIPVSQTLFSPFNLLLLGATVAGLTALAVLLHPVDGQELRVDPVLLVDAKTQYTGGQEHGVWLDRQRWMSLGFGALALAWAVGRFRSSGWRAIDLNTVILLTFALAVVLHRTPAQLLSASESAASTLGGIVLQFPLYAGIYGVFRASGLTERIGEVFVSLCTTRTFPGVVYLYSGLVNYFVPSGGSKWAIEAPYLLEAAHRLGVVPAKVVLAYAWGDMATDLVQPFWALPLLAVARLDFKDLFGFLGVAFLVYFPLVAMAFFAWG
ncbi:MAG: short-chain fatty acid transporter [Myxococcaceae bacterium]